MTQRQHTTHPREQGECTRSESGVHGWAPAPHDAREGGGDGGGLYGWQYPCTALQKPSGSQVVR